MRGPREEPEKPKKPGKESLDTLLEKIKGEIDKSPESLTIREEMKNTLERLRNVLEIVVAQSTKEIVEAHLQEATDLLDSIGWGGMPTGDLRDLVEKLEAKKIELKQRIRELGGEQVEE